MLETSPLVPAGATLCDHGVDDEQENTDFEI